LTLLAFVCGVSAAVGGLTLAGRRGVRTRYRPDRFALPEQLTMLAGLVAAGVTIWASVVQPGVINPPIGVLVWPVVPWPVLAGLMLAAGPAFFTPPAVLTQQADDALAVVR
jgi:energy-coupling factor transport system permease protein